MERKPTKIVSMGGLISLPVCFAGSLLQIPFELWELNAIPGKAVTFLRAFATMNYICFAECALYMQPWVCKKVLYPIRFTHVQSSDEGKRNLGIDSTYKKIILFWAVHRVRHL